MADNWLITLEASTPQAGFDLAIKLSRMAVKITQPNDKIRQRLRTVYESDANAMIAVSAVVATNFQTISAANDHWKYSR